MTMAPLHMMKMVTKQQLAQHPPPRKKLLDKKGQRIRKEDNRGSFFGEDEYHKINLVKNNNVLLPHIVVHWVDQHLQNRCTVFVWTLTGVSPSDINATILEGGNSSALEFHGQQSYKMLNISQPINIPMILQRWLQLRVQSS